MTLRDESVQRIARDGTASARASAIAVEAPVAVEFNGIGYAVMMMTPADLPDFALGFAITERIADSAADVIDVDVADVALGTVLRITVSPHAATRIGERIRHRTSDTSCGLCGIASLENLSRPLPPLPPASAIVTDVIFTAVAALRNRQPLGIATGATHAAAWADASGTITHVAEDVGRHNALDKLIGMLGGGAPDTGFCVVTSRLSFEMVDKALAARIGTLVGISAATSMALDHARTHGLTLVALAREDAMLVMNRP